MKLTEQIKCGEHSLRDSESVSSAEEEWLIGFYKKCGYKFIKGSDYMYKVEVNELFEILGI